MERVDTDGLTFYRHEAWGDIRHGIFTRRGGASRGQWSSLNLGASIGDDLAAVKENHRRMYRAVDVNPERAVSAWLVHSIRTRVIDERTKLNGKLPKADALVTDQADTPLVMRYADCVPLLLYDPVRYAIGLGHAGWRGTVLGMAAEMVRAMITAFACSPKNIQALIGPAISQRNYRVGKEVAEAADAYFGDDAGVVASDAEDGTLSLDLWRANQLDLARQGVTNVAVHDVCTYDNTGEFYSHRAERGPNRALRRCDFAMSIADNIARVEERIAAACARVGRDPAEVTLVGISKQKSVEDINAAIGAGLRHIGENRVEEGMRKIPLVEVASADAVTWHMVGHVQSRKAKHVIQHFDLVQSIDSVRLAQRFSRLAADAERELDVLIEINVSGEASKYGFRGYNWYRDAAVKEFFAE